MPVAHGTESRACLRTHDVNEARTIMEGRGSRHVLRMLGQPGQLDFRLRQAALDGITFLEVSYGHDVEIITPGPVDFYVLQRMLEGTCEICTNSATLKIGPGDSYVVNPATTYRKRWSADAVQLMVRLPRGRMEQLAGLENDEQPVVFQELAKPLPPVLDELVKFFWRDVMMENRARSSAIDRSASRHLMTAVLHLLPNSANADLAPSELPQCLPRADQYIRRNLAHHIDLADIADAAGVSTRSLETAFRRCWRTTPVTHVRNLRLDAARRMLTHPVAGMSVTDAACAAGVTHLGRFSQSYFRRYGELPSESLNRASA
jgi:AraC-like DNA-binding protein